MLAKRFYVKTFLSIALFLALAVCMLPKDAEAVTIRVQNRYSQTMWLSFVLYNDAKGVWEVRGWWNVSPNSTRNLDFNGSTKQRNVWIHAYTSEAQWGGAGNTPRYYTVLSETFRYQAGKAAPNGKGSRKVGFTKYVAENNGIVNYRP